MKNIITFLLIFNSISLLSQTPIISCATCVESVEDLRGLTIIDIGGIVYTKSYYTGIKGGSNIYKKIGQNANTSLDNGGTVIVGNDGSLYEMNDTQIVNVKQFGAIADGVNNDTQALNNYIEYCSTSKKAFVINENEKCKFIGNLDLYRYSPASLDDKAITNINMKGELIGNVNSVITVGHTSVLGTPKDYNFNLITNSTLKLQGLKNANININKCDTLLLYANENINDIASSAYNSISIGEVKKIEIHGEGSQGWINENHFYLSRIKDLRIHGDYNHNHNIFHGATFENSIIDIENGSSNIFHDVRFEGSVDLTFGSNSRNNFFQRSWENHRASSLLKESLTYTDNGVGNQIEYSQNYSREKDIIFEINKTTNNYNIPDVIRNGSNLTITSWKTIYETDKIELNDDIALNYKSDSSIFRIALFLYDENGILIPTNPDNGSGNGISFNSTNGYYTFSSNSKERHIALFKNEIVKYYSIKLFSGNGLGLGQDFNYCILELNKSKKDPVSIPIISAKRLQSNAPPSIGNWELGTIVYNKTPQNNIGWILTDVANNTWTSF